MKKLGKKINGAQESIQAYCMSCSSCGCGCNCNCSGRSTADGAWYDAAYTANQNSTNGSYASLG